MKKMLIQSEDLNLEEEFQESTYIADMCSSEHCSFSWEKEGYSGTKIVSNSNLEDFLLKRSLFRALQKMVDDFFGTIELVYLNTESMSRESYIFTHKDKISVNNSFANKAFIYQEDVLKTMENQQKALFDTFKVEKTDDDKVFHVKQPYFHELDLEFYNEYVNYLGREERIDYSTVKIDGRQKLIIFYLDKGEVEVFDIHDY